MQFRASVLTGVLAIAAATGACGSHNEISGPSNTDPGAGWPRPPLGVDTGCDSSKVQWAVGQPATEDLLQRARTAAGASAARFLRPDEPVTREYLATRLNLVLDASNVVRTASCG
jgi:hypothetical protein